MSMNKASPVSPPSTSGSSIPTPPSSDITYFGSPNKMLSINFSTPLAGPARSERIKQMTNSHPAFTRARTSQEILVKIQTSLRRMPGVSSNEANEIIGQLQEVGQIISTETSQLVDALMNVTLDQQETDKAVARMSIDANLAKAENEDQTKTISNLRLELHNEKEKRETAEEEVSKVMKDLQDLTYDFKALKEKDGSNDGSPAGRTGMIKQLEDTIQHLEGQVNNRRSLWVMKKNSDPQAVARAIETLADSCDNKAVVQKIMSLHSNGDRDEGARQKPHETKKLSRVFSDMTIQPTRSVASFQPVRPPTAAPPKFGPLLSGPPRAPSVAPRDRVQTPWGQNSPIHSRFGESVGTPGYGRAPSRRGLQAGIGYRPNAPEFYPSSSREISRPDSSYGHGHGHGHGRDYYPTTPSTMRSRYGRTQDVTSPDYNNAYNNAVVIRNQSVGPLIHVTAMAIDAWHKQIMDLYSVIRSFVEHNANEPTFANPADLPKTKLWPVLLATYHPLSEAEAVSYLDYHLKEESSKSCLVTRVVIDYIVNRVWVPGAWTGSNHEATWSLMEVEKDLERTLGQPSSARQPILDRQAAIVDSVMKREQNSQFSRNKIEEMVETLMSTIQPLLNDMAHPGDTYEDLAAVAETAWALSSKILTSRLTFDFRFPEVGCRFSCQSMVPIWPNFDPMELQAKHWRVALVTTPVITCRNDTGANISAHSVSLADVVCMQ